MTRRISRATFIAAAAIVVVVLALFVSPVASDEPDGLEKVAAENGFEGERTTRAVVDDDLSVAGLIGVTATFAVVGATFLVLRRTRRTVEPTAT